MIKSVAGILAGVSGGGQAAQAASNPDTTNMQQSEKTSHNYQNMNRKAFVTLPGISRPTIYANLQSIIKGRNPPPLILMDQYDYDRLWGQVVMERGQKEQMIWLLLDELIRRGLIQTMDYTRFYSAEKQKQNILNYRKGLRSLPDHIARQAAVEAADGFLDVCYGEYQQTLRTALGGWEATCDRAATIEHQQDKMADGTGHTICWNDRVFGQYIAALEVGAAVDRHANLDVVGVIGQGDGAGISTVFQSADMGFDDGIVSLSRDGNSIEQIERPHPGRAQFERDVLDTISQVARETTGTQHDDWYILGSHLALPHLPRLFRRSWGSSKLKEPSTLAAEAQEVLDYLDKEAEDNRPVATTSKAEAIAEQYEVTSATKVQEISEQLDSAIDLANHSRDLRELTDSDYSPEAVFTAASIKMDPKHQYDENEVYRRAVDAQNRLKPVDVYPSEVEHYGTRGGFRRGDVEEITCDWYQLVERGTARA